MFSVKAAILPFFLTFSLKAFGGDAPGTLGVIGYFCQVRYTPAATGYGNAGYISTILWSAPNCGGAFVNQYNFCTKTATAAVCPTSANYLYDGNSILALFQEIRGHAAAGRRVIVQGGVGSYTCNHAQCGAVVDFYGD